MSGILSRFLSRLSHGEADRQFIDEMRSVLADGELTDEEREFMAHRHAELGAGDAWNDVKGDLYLAAVRGALKGGRLAPAAEAELDEIRAYLQVGGDDLRRGDELLSAARAERAEAMKAADAQRRWDAYLDALRRADVPPVACPAVVMPRGERAVLVAPMTAMEYKAVGRQYRGGGSGVSIRVTKGMSLRVGGGSGVSAPIMDMVPVSEGHLVVTTQRFVFNGDLKSWADPLSKVIGFQGFRDGVQYSINGREKPRILRFSPGTRPDEVFAAIEGVMNRMLSQS
jgi:hypothetical protein